MEEEDFPNFSLEFKPLRFASWFPTLISCSPNLPRVYIRLCKHGNHFIFLHFNSTHLSRLISANWTFHIRHHNRSFPQSKNRNFCTKFPSQLIRIFTHCAALFKNSKQSMNMLPIKSADSRADKMLDIQ